MEKKSMLKETYKYVLFKNMFKRKTVNEKF